MAHTDAIPTPTRRRAYARTVVFGLVASVLLVCGGCQIVGIAGVMAESYKRTSTQTILAEYSGLRGKSFAVIVSADRVIQSDHPNLVPRMQMAVIDRLRQNAGASGFVPPDLMMVFLASNPRWAARPYSDIAEELGVERLIVIEMIEFRLHEPGNSYIWNGAAAASVGVVEADGPLGDEFVYRKQQRVVFPDSDGYGPMDFGASYVSMRLQTRLLDRITWLFYDHEEPYYPDY